MQTARDTLIESRRIIAAAQAEAARIIAAARTEAELIKEQAMAEGRATGIAQMAIQATQLEACRERILTSLAPNIAEVICCVAAEIFSDAPLNADQLNHRLREALQQITFVEQLTLVLHPEDRSTGEQFCQQLKASNSGIRIAFRDDESLNRGACRLETDTAVIESDPQLHLRNILEHLTHHARELFALPAFLLPPSIGGDGANA